jgi:hypothetical protein
VLPTGCLLGIRRQSITRADIIVSGRDTDTVTNGFSFEGKSSDGSDLAVGTDHSGKVIKQIVAVLTKVQK